MLKKSIFINLSIGYGDFSKAMGLILISCILSIVCMAAYNPAAGILLLAGILVGLIYCLRGMNKIFNTSLYSEVSSFYMVLPLSSREIVLGKIIAAAFFNFGCTMILFLMPMITVWIYGADGSYVTDILFSDYLSPNLPPKIVAVLTGLLPLKALLHQMAFCAFAMTVLLTSNLLKPGRQNIAPWLAVFAIDQVVSQGLKFMTELLPKTAGPFLSEGLVDCIYIALFLFLFSYCVKTLRTKYDI